MTTISQYGKSVSDGRGTAISRERRGAWETGEAS